ncbi:hypothetical protein EVAR_61006_1 [Eumeta japonica]|uniref:Uncharacterized protein n=1 Tax=Eumeta variegata TaxID=151549 RepID=A0A4C1Z8N4_EUMVA|nr:hypothetical protein EVAR_61006_1 [Eumeta japonica]
MHMANQLEEGRQSLDKNGEVGQDLQRHFAPREEEEKATDLLAVRRVQRAIAQLVCKYCAEPIADAADTQIARRLFTKLPLPPHTA